MCFKPSDESEDVADKTPNKSQILSTVPLPVFKARELVLLGEKSVNEFYVEQDGNGVRLMVKNKYVKEGDAYHLVTIRPGSPIRLSMGVNSEFGIPVGDHGKVLSE